MTDYNNLSLLTQNMEAHIKKVIKSIFIKLTSSDLDILQEFVIILIDIIACKFNIKPNTIELFFGQLSQNNNRDIISIMYLLLLYIDDKNNFELYKKITKLEDITCMKKKIVNESENNYVICNYQYSRYVNANINKSYLNNALNDKINTNEHYNEYKYSSLDLEMSLKIVLSTIDKVISKLYINWINIIPLTIEDYKDSDKYKNSFDYNNDGILVYKDIISNKEETFDFWNLNLDSKLRQYGGVNAYDIFDTIFVFLFNQIIQSGTKWLLYEKQEDLQKQPKMYLEIINDLVNIKYLYYSEIYDTITLIERKSIETRWSDILEQAYNNIESLLGNFIKCVIFKFDQKFCDNEISEEYDYDYTSLYEILTEKDLDELDDEDNFLDSIDYSKINLIDLKKKIKDFQKIPFEIIYDFLTDIIQKFKLTWYGKQIFEKDNNDLNINTKLKFGLNTELKIGINYFITYKNIYNFAKHISKKFTGSDIKIIDSRCLSNADKVEFLAILNKDNNNVINSFNIKNVLGKTYNNIKTQDIKAVQEAIANYFLKYLKDIVFVTYIQAGLLNRFEIDEKLTNESILGSSETERKKNIKKELYKKFEKDKKKYLSTYYYLTGDKYEHLEIYNKKKEKIDWFDFTFKEAEPWYFSFAMNWVSQINFYNHFINNRVLLVTGATGQGKSTEVPKLLYYALIAINLNFTARVISTQPTVIPTKKNAKIISTNLGVPLEVNDYKTFSSYLQYSTQEEKHLVKGSNTFIKEVTDRTLFEEIVKNPYLKKQKKGKNGKMDYSSENVYDIVIIDEAHMHNINMDLILTFMRNVVHINNQIKLVITSATMDDDEYIYRRYYRIIDDNYGYPLCSIKTNLEFNRKANSILDKIVVDRRYHISPPGQTTKYTVKDIYLDNDTKNYQEGKQAGLKILDEIMKKNLTGDVLFFTTSVKEILDIIKFININSPGHVIALPLYAELKSKPGAWFEKIENININLPNIIYDKKEILDVIENGDAGYRKISPNTYSMAIVVATNVVEASVTIPSLRFVIDTGYFVSVVFDSDKEDKEITIDQIPEASRLQRRGRVGRVAGGTVYYTYKKGARAHIKPRYGIVIGDVTFDLFKILHGFENSDKQIYNSDIHPINYLYNYYNDDTLTFENFIKGEENKIIKKIYMDQYYINTENLNSQDLISNRLVNSINFYKKYLNSPYDNGYDLRDLLDERGIFYIIHPEEEQFKREVVTGKIIYNKKENKKENGFLSSKIINSINKLQSIKYIYFDGILRDAYTDYIFLKKFKYDKIIDEILNKEKDVVGYLQKKYSEDDIVRIFKTICISTCYNCTDEIIKILSLLYSITSYREFVALQEIKKQISKFNDYDKFINLWKNNISELYSYLDIMNFFIQNNDIDEMEQKNKTFIINYIEKKFDVFNDIKKKYGNKIFIDTNIFEQKKLNNSEIKLYIDFINQKDNKEKRYAKFNTAFKIRKNKGKQIEIENYCNKMGINNKIILNAIRLYENLYKIFKRQEKNINSFKQFYPVFISSKSDNIIKCFLESYLSNLSIYKNKKLINLILNIEIDEPKVSLVYLPQNSLDNSSKLETLCFYAIKSDMGPLGLTIINKDILNDVMPTILLDINNDNFDLKHDDNNILKLTGKYNLNPVKENSMNVYIDNSLKIFKIKKYRFKKIYTEKN
jgi:hypothetical protein